MSTTPEQLSPDHAAADAACLILLSPAERNIVLNALHEKCLDLRRYVHEYSNAAKAPTSTDSRCPAHMDQYNRAVEMRASFKNQLKATQKIIDQLEAQEAAHTLSLPLDLEHVELVYKYDDGETKYTQQVNDLTEQGTLIDPDTGDDLTLVSVIIRDVLVTTPNGA